MASSDVADTERVIREKLESSGQFGKMRAMIMEAALQTVSSGTGIVQPSLFQPTTELTEAKRNGVLELSIVHEYLQYLGLQYTARVLELEAGLHEVPLHTKAELQQQLRVAADGRSEPCLSVLVRGEATGVKASTAVAAGHAATSEDDFNDAASDHNQPGGEDTTYFISKWSNRHFFRHHQVSGQQVQLENLMDCQTVVLDELDSMTVDECEGGELVVAACEGSVFLRNCKNMTVHVACKQLRTRDCENINIYIFTSTDPVVEMSHHISFYPFHLRLPALQQRFKEARLDPRANRFVHVYDFTPGEPQLPQPHFEVHFPEHHLSMEDRYAKYGPPECPPEIESMLSLQLMPAASSESGKNKSYDIRMGAQVWAPAAVTPIPVLPPAAAGAGADVPAKANIYSDEEEEEEEEEGGEDEETASDNDPSSSPGVQSSSASTASSSRPEYDFPAKHQLPEQPAKPRVDQPSLSAPLAPIVGTAAAANRATAGGIDNDEYSSFDDDDDDDRGNVDDTYDVDEDEDDF